MGIAAYQRGNRVISRQYEGVRLSPAAARALQRDHHWRQLFDIAETRLRRALARFRGACAARDLERARAAAILDAVERTYDEARAEGVRPGPALYWLGLARHRARAADPSAVARVRELRPMATFAHACADRFLWAAAARVDDHSPTITTGSTT